MMAKLEKLKELISAIEEGDYNKVKQALGKKNGYVEGSISPTIINWRNADKKAPLHIALEQPNSNNKIIQSLLDSGADVSYRYTGPFDKTKQKIQGDNYLHIAARARNKEAFVTICKKNIAFVTVHNEDGNNPFHEAARSSILLPVVKEVMNYLEGEANKKIEKAEKAKNWKELRELKEEFKCNKKYIKDALCSKDYAFNKNKRTPLYYLDASEKKEIKQIAGIKDKLICNKNFHLCLYIVGAMLSIAALCLSLYLLFLTSQAFALSSMASMAFAGVTYLSLKVCSEIHDLHNEDASVQDVRITQVSEEVLAV